MSSDGGPAEWLTVAEAAARLGVSVPRLRRLLARPDLAPLVENRTRQTRTGTRTAQGVPVPVLVSLRAALDALPDAATGAAGREPRAEPKQERERERQAEASEPFAVAAPYAPGGEVLYLRERLADALQLLAREQQAHAETRQLMAAQMAGQIAATNTASENAPAPHDGSRGATGDDLQADAAETGQSADGAETAPDVAQRGKWWQIWKR